MEWLDVVDDTDHVIGRALRTEIHLRQLRHRSSHVVLYNRAGHVFVQRRSELKAENPNLWDSSAAGHVDSGETYLECAVRELQEELGLTVQPGQLVPAMRLPPSAANGFEFASVFALTSDQHLTLQAEEIAEGRWLGISELDTWMQHEPAVFTSVFRDIWCGLRA